MRRLLRVIAVVGVVARLALAAWDDHRDPQALSMRPALAVAAAAILAMAALLRRETRTALRRADVLVPIALALIVEGFVERLSTEWAWLAAGKTYGAELLGLRVSALSLITAAAWTVSAAWTTLLVLDAAAGRPVDLLGALRRVPRALVPTLLALAIGTAGVDAIMILALAAGDLGPPLLGFFLALLAILTLAWNLATTAVLAAAVKSGSPLARSISEGFRASRRHLRRFAVPVVVQLVILGLVVVAAARVSRVDAYGETVVVSRSTVRTGVIWVGGYEEQSRWIDVFSMVEERDPSRALLFASRVVGLLLAVAIKVRVAGAISGPRRAVGSSPPSTARPS